jgi:hypothetical protein
MFQVSSNLAWRQGATAIVLVGAVVLGFTLRAASPAEPLGQADDYGTRHASAASVVQLSEIDDYGTRLIAKPVLGPQDDFGTRHATVATPLTEVDDYGTRNDGR